MGIRDNARIRRVGGYQVNGFALYQIERPRIPNISPDLRRNIISIQRRVSEIQPVARHHDSVGIYIDRDGASAQKFALHRSCARACHLVKHKLARLRVAQDEVARDVGRPVAPVVACVRGPVAAVGEGPDCCGFGSEGGGGEF